MKEGESKMEEIQEVFKMLQKRKFPCCITFMCLLRGEELEADIMPRWFTRLVNWTVREV